MKKFKRPCPNSPNPQYVKRGCPEKCWDPVSGEGCPNWKEYTFPAAEDGKPPVQYKDCIINLQEVWAFKALGLLEGNQVAIESARNEIAKPNNGALVLAGAVERLAMGSYGAVTSGGPVNFNAYDALRLKDTLAE